MHPIEHLRYLARSHGADTASLVRETAVALSSLRGDRANLVLACRRIVERHPEAAPLWWLCSHVLVAADPSEVAWRLAEQIEDDPSPVTIAAVLPGESRVLTIGWPEVGGAALARRGDVTVWCADSRHRASSFMQRLERVGVACEPVPAEMLARAATLADLVVVEAVAASPRRVLAPIGSSVLAATARSTGTPVWLVAGLGTRLPGEYVDAIAERTIGCADDTDPFAWDVEIDELALNLVTHVASVDGVDSRIGDALRPDCTLTPELLRTSAI